MIASVAKKLANKEKGFTLIELLVVVVIIGILAAIAIPAFLKQRENAWRAAVESDVKNASIAAESYATTKNGTYEDLTTDVAKANGYNATAGVDVTVTPDTGNLTYTITGKHDNLKSGNTLFTFTSKDGKSAWSASTGG